MLTNSFFKRVAMHMEPIRKIKGFQDITWQEALKYNFLEERARNVFARYGFSEIRIPVLEKTDLFSRTIGEDTDIVQKEMYTFPDKKGRSLTMRPEATASVARAYIENKIYNQEKISKFYTIGPMFRYERPQKGRMRQFHQVNAELFGTVSPQADAEIINMMWTYFQEIGIKGLNLEINSLGCPECRPNYKQKLQDELSGINPDNLCPDCRKRSQTNPMRLFDCKNPECKQHLQDFPLPMDYLCPDCRKHFEKVLDLLSVTGIKYSINKMLVRGLDYYQKTTFELTSDQIGAQSAIAGGGRYDGLIRQLGGPDTPAIGFACGLERIMLLMQELDKPGIDFYLVLLHEKAMEKGHKLAQKLREQGLSGNISYQTSSAKSQLREANKQNARKCILLGEEELQNNTLQVKDMLDGTQKQIQENDIAQVFCSIQNYT